jgi:ferredoxin-NADP reductase
LIDETADTRTLVLAPGRRWPGHHAGQYVPIEIEVDGARVRRCYSISSGGAAPGARRIGITVRRVPGGRASTALHRLRRGAVVGLGTPAGDFVLDAEPASKVLLVAGGSGITPVMAMIRDLAERRRETRNARDSRDIIVIHASRSAADTIFGAELARLAAGGDGLRIHLRRGDSIETGRLDVPGLRALVPDLAEREIFVCGPLGLMELVDRTARDAGALRHVHRELFVAPAAGNAGAAVPVTVALRRSGIEVVAAGPGPLLAQLERAGQHPAFGCRMGICHSCRCRKLRGTVEDSMTGAVSSEPDQDIRLCVSLARSDLELAL